MATYHQLRVGPLPAWLDPERLLGHSAVAQGDGEWMLEGLPTTETADLTARLRGLVLAGHATRCSVTPALPRAAVRAARLRDARRRRATSPGFSRRGVRLDEEGRISLTPEALAMEMASEACGRCVVDATCGAGGNAIAFARAGCPVIAVDLDRERLALARHNAGRYGVAGRIEFIHGDARDLLPRLDGELLMLDPPWGRDTNREGFGLPALPLLGDLLPLCARFPETWVKLPPAFAVDELPAWRPRAVFGSAEGDFQRIKFLWLARGGGEPTDGAHGLGLARNISAK